MPLSEAALELALQTLERPHQTRKVNCPNCVSGPTSKIHPLRLFFLLTKPPKFLFYPQCLEEKVKIFIVFLYKLPPLNQTEQKLYARKQLFNVP